MNAISVRYEAILDGRDPEDGPTVATELGRGAQPSGREGLPLGQGGRALELVGLSINEVAVRGAVVVERGGYSADLVRCTPSPNRYG